MSKVLVFVQHEDGKVGKGSLCALSAAQELQTVWGKTGVCAVVLGAGAATAARDVAEYGVESVHYCEDPIFAKFRAEPYARAVALAAKNSGCDVVVGLASSSGKDLLPRVAVMLDAGQASEIVAVNADGSLKRPMYAGNIMADVEVLSAARVVSVRGTAFSPALKSGAPGTVALLELSGDPELKEQPRFGEVLGYEQSKADRPELSDAEVVVSGGRALGSAENFQKVIYPLAATRQTTGRLVRQERSLRLSSILQSAYPERFNILRV
jgi:electron transfer flavoprotein alpha subunit